MASWFETHGVAVFLTMRDREFLILRRRMSAVSKDEATEPENGLIQSPLSRRVAVPVERMVACGDHHALGIEMIVKAFGAELAPDA